MNTGQPVTVDATLNSAIAATLRAAGLTTVAYRWVLVLETVEADGRVRRPLISPHEIDLEPARELVLDTAAAINGYRCICGGNSATPQCPDFPDCLPGGERS